MQLPKLTASLSFCVICSLHLLCPSHHYFDRFSFFFHVCESESTVYEPQGKIFSFFCMHGKSILYHEMKLVRTSSFPKPHVTFCWNFYYECFAQHSDFSPNYVKPFHRVPFFSMFVKLIARYMNPQVRFFRSFVRLCIDL